jgi:DNA repair exonuclease SbcCD ATPase subunit
MELDDIRSRLEALEKANGRLSKLVAEIRDAVTIMAEVQRRQASVQRTQAGELDALREFALRHQEFVQRHEKVLADFDVRMKEIGDKLDGLIGYVGGL